MLRLLCLFAVLCSGVALLSQEGPENEQDKQLLKLYNRLGETLQAYEDMKFAEKRRVYGRQHLHIFNLRDLCVMPHLWRLKVSGQFLRSPETIYGVGTASPEEEPAPPDDKFKEKLILLTSSIEDRLSKEIEAEKATLDINGPFLMLVGSETLRRRVEQLLARRKEQSPLKTDLLHVQIVRVDAAKVATLEEQMLLDETGRSNLLQGAEILRSACVCLLRGATCAVFDGKEHAVAADIDTSGMGGLTPTLIAEPVVKTVREGLLLQISTADAEDGITVTLRGSLARLLKIGERTSQGGMPEAPTYKVDVPEMRYEQISVRATIPRAKTLAFVCGMRENKAVVVLVKPTSP